MYKGAFVLLEGFRAFFRCKFFLFQQWTKKIIHFRLKRPLAYVLVYLGIFVRRSGRPALGLNLVLKGRRVANVVRANALIKHLIESAPHELELLLPSTEDIDIKLISRRILVLKLPEFYNDKIVEKGAIVVKFSESFSFIFKRLDVVSFSEYFNIILEPSSVGYSLPEILVWCKLTPNKVFIMAPYSDDYDFILGLESNLVPLRLGPSDWVNTNVFFKVHNEPKKYDAVYIANFNPIKRVERFIKAVSRIQKERPSFHAALVLASHGDKKNEIKNFIKYFENKVNIDYLPPISQSQLNILFNRSKVNMLISLREGSNKGLAEGLFSGTPALLIEENAGGNHVHMNSFTGRVVKDSELESAMIWLADNYDKLSPDSWVLDNMSPQISAAKLSDVLKKHELKQGRNWERNLVPKVNSPELSYVNADNEWLLNKRLELLEIFAASTDQNVFSARLRNLILNK